MGVKKTTAKLKSAQQYNRLLECKLFNDYMFCLIFNHIFRCTKLCKVGHCLMLFGSMFQILIKTEQPKPVALYCTPQS